MVENTKKLYVLFTILGNKLVDEKKRSKLLSKGEGVWQEKTAKLFKRTYSVYHGTWFAVICVFTGLFTLFGFLDLLGTTFAEVSWSDPVFLSCNVVLVLLVILMIVVRNAQHKAVISLLEADRTVTFENGVLSLKSSNSNIEWNIDSCIDMVDTQYGFFLLFDKSPLQFISIKDTDTYNMLYSDIKNSINDGVYKMIAI